MDHKCLMKTIAFGEQFVFYVKLWYNISILNHYISSRVGMASKFFNKSNFWR